MFLDEPTTGLDSSTAIAVLNLLKEYVAICNNHCYSVFPTNYIEHKLHTRMYLAIYIDEYKTRYIYIDR